MATTSLSLGVHWEQFIQAEITQGRYASASEVVRDALRVLETRSTKLALLRTHLVQGAGQAKEGDFVADFSMQNLIATLDSE